MRNDVRVVQTFIDTMTGLPKFSYPARQNGATRPSTFASVIYLEEYPVGIPSTVITNQTQDETTYTTESLSRVRFRIKVVDNEEAASKIMHGWTSQAMKTLMLSSKYGFIKCSTISNEDAKLEKEWEHRMGFALDLYIPRVYQETVDNIRTFNIEGHYVEDQTEIYLGNFNINDTD